MKQHQLPPFFARLTFLSAFLLSALLPIGIQAASSPISTAQNPTIEVEINDETEAAQALAELEQKQQEVISQLAEIQTSLVEKKKERDRLRAELKKAPEPQKQQITEELEVTLVDIQALEKSFEQIAIGGIDLSVFGVEEKQFDWREELVTIVKPLLENLKSLTEKPRKIESLRRIIREKSQALEASNKAIVEIEALIEQSSEAKVNKRLAAVLDDWQYRAEEIGREIQLAEFQLDNLEQRNVPWLEVLRTNLAAFAEGRGLTILILIAAVLATLAVMRGILWLIRKRVANSDQRSEKTYYRLAAYGYRMLTAVMIVLAIMVVLYLRQDVLLLAVTFVILFGLLLALKNLLPKYVTESRILLNMGGIREKERVIYNGVPWQVSSLNVHSHFNNPEIRGVLRIPISQMHEMISRPNNGDSWFPSSEGDWIIGEDGNPEQVIRQSVDVVELRDLNSIAYTVPTTDYYQRGYPNISRAKTFRIAITFGIDYATQTIDPADIEAAFTDGMKAAFKGTDTEEYIRELDADFHSAGDSSLNYLMLATFDSAVAGNYNRIKRRIQRACVQVCNEQGWSIPFPQLTVHSGGKGAAEAE